MTASLPPRIFLTPSIMIICPLSYLVLQTPDFAWKFIWTVRTKWASMQKNVHGIHARKIPWTMELDITQTFFELQTQDFAWKFV